MLLLLFIAIILLMIIVCGLTFAIVYFGRVPTACKALAETKIYNKSAIVHLNTAITPKPNHHVYGNIIGCLGPPFPKFFVPYEMPFIPAAKIFITSSILYILDACISS